MTQAILTGILAVVVIIAAAIAFVFVRRWRAAHPSPRKAKAPAAPPSVPGVRPAVHSMAPAGAAPAAQGAGEGTGLHGRFVAMGVLLAAVFGSLSVKLWSLQVLEGARYAEEAQNNLYTHVTTQAPRGVIYDADGKVLVDNTSTIAVVADADVAQNHDVMQRLSVVLGLPYGVVKSRIRDTSNGAQSQRVVESDATIREAAFISEHATAFPGVSTQQRTVRHYPYGALAAHVLGYTGTVSEKQLENVEQGRTMASGDQVGQSGIEQRYDDLLAGEHGVRTLVVDSSGEVQQVVGETSPTRGSDLYLTLRG